MARPLRMEIPNANLSNIKLYVARTGIAKTWLIQLPNNGHISIERFVSIGEVCYYLFKAGHVPCK